VVRPQLVKAGYTNAADSVRLISLCGSQEKKNSLTQLTEESVHELLFKRLRVTGTARGNEIPLALIEAGVAAGGF
jgi:hypothetical protein